jgi:hypothetical protein
MSEPERIPNVYEAVPQADPEAIVVYCSDPRFQTAFEPFLETELGLRKGQFVPFVIAGGAGVLANPERLPKEFKFMKDRFVLFRHHFPSLRRVVLINHEDCAYYKMLGDKIPGLRLEQAGGLAHQPRADLEPIAAVFHRLLSHLGLGVELYYARFADGDHCQVVFERLPAAR